MAQLTLRPLPDNNVEKLPGPIKAPVQDPMKATTLPEFRERFKAKKGRLPKAQEYNDFLEEHPELVPVRRYRR